MSQEPRAGRVLTATQLALLTAVQDRLIPREGDWPGAGEAGGAAAVDEYLTALPELRREIVASLQAIEVTAGDQRAGSGGSAFVALHDDERDKVLRAVEQAQPKQFRTLLRQTYRAYYTTPSIQATLGVGAAAPQPSGHTIPPPFDESLLAQVKQRGQLWHEA